MSKSLKCLGTWKGDTLSSREKTILIESYPSSVSMYAMGVYQLYEGGHINNYIQLDLSSFGNDMGKKKYHMVKWDALDKPNDFVGLVS